MELKTQEKLQRMFDRVMESLCRSIGAETYEKAIAALREQVRNGDALPAAWLHKIAVRLYPAIKDNTVQPEYFYEILGLIDTRDKVNAILLGFPEDEIPKAEKALRWMLREWLPGMRANSQLMAASLPRPPAGGRPTKIPSNAECLKICREINKRHGEGTQLTIAQDQVAKKTGIHLRTIQRIWSKRKQYRTETGLQSSPHE